MPSTRTRSTSASKKESDNDKNADNKSSPPTNDKFENSWMLLAKDEVFQEDAESVIITLTHPGLLKPSKFLINKTTYKLFEILTFDEPYRSWFIDNTVKSDGKLYLSTPIDPLFIILPLLKSHCTARAVPLEHVMESSKDADFKQLSCIKFNLNPIADLKGPADLSAYKYSEEKVLAWLESKVRKVATALKKKKMHVKPGAVSATFVTSSIKGETVDEDDYLKYGCGIVGEYLDDETFDLLNERFKFKPEINATPNNKRKSEVEANNGDHKKIKVEEVKEEPEEITDRIKSSYFTTPVAIQPKVTKSVALSAREKERKKAASGTKSITSFFTKK